MGTDLTSHQMELLSRVLQHGGVLASPFGHAGEDSLLSRVLEDIGELESRGLITVKRFQDSQDPQQIELTAMGYAALGIE
ncbi:hypothetical protein L861_09675 [Litchfieldella anticariensis FP35 = DSM 16096]|uniref:MarR family transcriptional regulator n=1 Tax=Litchfieldella anticariensis (strain DSM 16096 / CECT 5854 / CIP 108499 / LMG 22089 / FP35) TaxID=1121939 RepID=S2KKB6_LITA3|nr:hypothetical protein [Halomonas anticariensis]EPC02602.1 hypothetical protein L861_09675 [Halomonas anticariensis FP35 = DSM 16096]